MPAKVRRIQENQRSVCRRSPAIWGQPQPPNGQVAAGNGRKILLDSKADFGAGTCRWSFTGMDEVIGPGQGGGQP